MWDKSAYCACAEWVVRSIMSFLGTSVCDILKYRKQFYEGSYDVRVICERNEYPESITRKVIDSVNQLAERGVYVSTRQRDTMEEKTFFDVVLEGLAPDGGLYVPGREIPRMTLGIYCSLFIY